MQNHSVLEKEGKIFSQKKRAQSQREGIRIMVGKDVLDRCSELNFQSDWDTLYNACPWATVFQSRPFVSNWYLIYQKEFIPIIVYEKAFNKITGLLTLAIDKNGLITGAGANQAEYNLWLASNTNNKDFIKSALHVVIKNFPHNSIEFKYIGNKVLLDWINDPFWNKRCFVKRSQHPFVVIEKAHFENKLRKSNRRNKINRLKKIGNIEFDRITTHGQFSEVIDELAMQADFRKGAMFNKFYFRDDPLKKRFLKVLFENNLLHVTVLKIDDKIIASNIGTVGKDGLTMHSGINSHLPFFSKYSPGILHFLLLGRSLADEHVQILDLGPGENSYKKEITSNVAPLYVLCVNSVYKTFSNKIKYAFISNAKRIAQKMSVKPTDLLKIKSDFRLVAGKLNNIIGSGLPSILINLQNRIVQNRKIKKFVAATYVSEAFPTNSINIKKDSLYDLLNFKNIGGTTLTEWEFLSNAMQRFENEEHSFTWAENNLLYGCVWTDGKKNIPGETNNSLTNFNSVVALRSLYLHPAALHKLEDFLNAVKAAMSCLK